MLKQQLLILTSPPATGKTYWIQNLIGELRQIPLLIITPLRALADECKFKWKDEEVTVMTPEEWMVKRSSGQIVIFDEFHLHFYWGDSFRPLMWEVFYEASMQAELTVLLTATLPSFMRQEIAAFSTQFDEIIWCDFGNQKLKFLPHKYIKAPSKKFLSDLILHTPHTETSLIFCAYRQEVLTWEKKLKQGGYSVWTCLGGEASAFALKVQEQAPPQFIVATTVLSHGVNLPRISRIYFLYQVQNLDFWVQMVARGGRRGENFEVYARENPYGIKWNRWINCLQIAILGLRIRRYKLNRQFSQWFLKD